MRAPLTETDGAHIHIALLFVFQRLKISCFKTAVLKTRVHATVVVPSLGIAHHFVLADSAPTRSHLLLSPLHAPWWRVKIAVIQMMKNDYRKQCILRHNEINDRAKYETIDFLFRPSDIYRHIAQP